MNLGDTLVSLTGILVGCSIVLIPLVAIVFRFVLKPMVDSWLILRQTPDGEERVAILERRIALLERQVEGEDRRLQRLVAD